MKQGMKEIESTKTSGGTIVLCRGEYSERIEFATYVRINGGDFYGHYFLDLTEAMKDYEARIAAYLELATFADLDRDADNFRLSDDSHLLSPEDDLYHNEEKNERV